MYCTRFKARSSVSTKTMLGRLAPAGSAAPSLTSPVSAGGLIDLPSPACGGGMGRGAGSVRAGGGGLGGLASFGARLGCPKSGFLALQAATICGSTCGSGLVARGGCAVPSMIGLTQSTWMPSPVRAPPCVNPASRQAATISRHGPAACACAAVAPAKAIMIWQIAAIRIGVLGIVIAPVWISVGVSYECGLKPQGSTRPTSCRPATTLSVLRVTVKRDLHGSRVARIERSEIPERPLHSVTSPPGFATLNPGYS